jgi:hypothetical protein
MREHIFQRRWLFDTNDITREDWWTGRTGWADGLAVVLYLAASLLPLLWFAGCGVPSDWFIKPGPMRVVVLVYGGLVSVAPHIWLWRESSAFFEWSAKRYKNEKDLKEQRERFKLQADGAKALWASVIALYAAALLKFGGQSG